MLKSGLYDYSDAYILFKGTISMAAQEGDNPNNGDKEAVFKDRALFTDCMSKINNRQIDNSKDIYVVMPMYNSMKHSKDYSETSRALWQHYRY